MRTIEYHTVDKTSWPMRGPWDREPDKKQWQDTATGLPCLAVRGPGGHWCGYVGVPEGHQFYAQDYDNVDVQVHGGLTFAEFCAHGAEDSTICHVPEPGEPDPVWWLGFDCAHSGDFSPKWERRWSSTESYRDLAYVEDQCRKLAEQLGPHPHEDHGMSPDLRRLLEQRLAEAESALRDARQALIEADNKIGRAIRAVEDAQDELDLDTDAPLTSAGGGEMSRDSFSHPNFGREVRIEKTGREVHLIFVAASPAQADDFVETLLGALNLTLMGAPTSIVEDAT